MSHAVNDEALDRIFRQARTFRKWQSAQVTAPILMAIYDLMRLGPTTSNSCPARIVYVTTKAAKERLKPHLDEDNIPKVMSAPVTAILAYDLKFYEFFPTLRPGRPDNRDEWRGMSESALDHITMRNASLQGGYFILAARSLGLDCGPLSGFNNEGVDREFFAGTDWRSNFLCNLGYGDEPEMRPRAPRLSFDEACKIL